ncbi:hypothetical protein [Agromyces cerinus]|uniref:DUF1877 family protein n=1 Tax=Agromyces cerinus subsp. cerinus TaxID=232089 RepID=A0A1N6IBS8_9MICO|nr:hypothetical protein [Agromyces cerinus]SIO29480.1 hypothetical protein SAMN05443544_3879 [Agromyces cerinus subsp. cerinus]
MGILFDYFTAPDDAGAASVLEHGPLGPGAEPVFPTVSTKGIDPTVGLGTAAALLTGRTFDEILADTAKSGPIADDGDGSIFVVEVDAVVSDAIADADETRLREVAVPWAQSEEFDGRADPADLAEFLIAIRSIALTARSDQAGLYCWICI